MKINLNSGESLKSVMSGAHTTTAPVAKVDYLDTDGPHTVMASLTGATELTLLSGPTNGIRPVQSLSILNADTVSQTITISHVQGGTSFPVAIITLAAGDTLILGDQCGVLNSSGGFKSNSTALSTVLADDTPLYVGDGSDAGVQWSTGDASNHAAVIFVSDTSQQIHITDKAARTTDWNISAGTHPEVYVHSNTTPATDYVRIGNHTGTVADIDVVGGTTLHLQIGGTTAISILSTGITLPAGQDIIFIGTTGQSEIQITDNLADALSCKIIAGADIYTIDTSTGAVVFNFGATVRLNVLGDAQIGSATTDLVAFHGSTPTDQCAAYTQTFSTADRTHAARTATALTVADGAGTNDGTIGAITADASVIAAVQELAAMVNALIVDLADTASVVNAVVDDLQEKGLVG